VLANLIDYSIWMHYPLWMKKQYKTILFDLDGTLLDSIPGIVSSFRATIETFIPDVRVTDAEIVALIGRPLPVQMTKLGGEHNSEAMVKHYRKHNKTIIPTMEFYEGAFEVIDAIRAKNIQIGIVTAKHRKSTEITIEKYDLRNKMDLIITASDSQNHKPHPEPLLLAMKKLKAFPDSTLYIGDAIYDIQCAKAAGTDSAAALWGPNTKKILAAEKPTYMFDAISDLISLI